MTREEAHELVTVLSAGFPATRLGEDSFAVYVAMLSDLDYGTAAAAVMDVVRTRPYPTLPSVGEVREAVARRSGRLPMSGDEAWEIVERAVRQVGSYGEFPSDRYPEVGRVVDALGWIEICRSTNLTATRAHFLRFWESAAERTRTAVLTADGLEPRPGLAALPPSVAALLTGAVR